MDQATSLYQKVVARKEVILSAGAFQSPQLMMVSGTGPASVLNAAGIKPMLVNENVGQHLLNHTVFSLVAQVQPTAFYSMLSNEYTALPNA